MTKLLKIEKIIFAALIFFLFLQTRIILHSFGIRFNEWTSAYLYVSDILIAILIFFWLLRSFIKREPFVGKQFFGWPGVFLGIFLLVVVIYIIQKYIYGK